MRSKLLLAALTLASYNLSASTADTNPQRPPLDGVVQPYWQFNDLATHQSLAVPRVTALELPSTPVFGTANVIQPATALQPAEQVNLRPTGIVQPVAVSVAIGPSYFSNVGQASASVLPIYYGFDGRPAPVSYVGAVAVYGYNVQVYDPMAENPEPGTLVLLGGGIMALWLHRRRRNASNEPDEVHSLSFGGNSPRAE